MSSPNEVVALEVAGDSDTYKFRTNFKPKKQLKHYPYFVDPQIVPRVKQYLEDNKHKVYVDIDEMVSELQRKYRDYHKKKRAPFKVLVEKAFSVVLKTYSMTDRDQQQEAAESDSSDSSEMEVDSEEIDLIVEHNQGTNQQMVNMYMQQQAMKKLAAGKGNSDAGKELIDISSDEEDAAPAKRAKHSDSTNGTDTRTQSQSLSHSANNTHANHSPSDNVRVNQTETPQNHLPPTNASKPSVQSPAPGPIERPKRKRQTADAASGSAASVNGDRRRRREVPLITPTCSFKDVGGCTKVLQEVCKLLVHVRHPEIFEQVGIAAPRGFLLHGPPGCGKTLLANAIAGELKVPLLKVAAPELVAGVSGESEERIRDLFEQAVSMAPCVLFIDEIDAITPNRNNAQREMERRIVAQLLTSIDELGDKEGGNQVLVLGATNRPDSIDPALRRAGRFDREVCMGIPDREARAHILRVVCGRLALSPEVASDDGINELAALTPGFVGADLTALTREAAMVAVNRIFADYKEQSVDVKQGSVIQGVEQKREDIPVEEVSLAVKEKEEVKNQTPVEDVSVVDEQNVTEQGKDTEDKNNASIMDGKKESDNQELTKSTQDSKQETVIVEEVLENEISVVDEKAGKEKVVETTSNSDDKKQETEVQEVVEVERAEGSLTQRPQGKGLASSAQEVEILLNDNGEKEKEKEKEEEVVEETVPKKTDDEVEVLEVDDSTGTCTAKTEVEVPQKDDNLAMVVEEETDQQAMTLSQKLNPLRGWTPELHQLLFLLRDAPPFTPAQLSNISVTMADFHEALRHVQPSAKREGFATVPDVTWADVGSLSNIREELQLAILAPVRYCKLFEQLGLNTPAGVLLCGPPGCGKTLLAKAIANEAGVNFISVKGPELLNMYVGESERAVRQVFQRARSSAPCVIFFDELDALCPKRSDSGDNGVSSRVVNQLLTEMDGVESRSDVFLMAASNRPDIIDPAVTRPGRLDKILFVGLPNAEDRADILRALTKGGTRPLLAQDVNLRQLADDPLCEGFTGADLAALVREAGVLALREYIGSGADANLTALCVANKHFVSALATIRPSVSIKDRKCYRKLQKACSSVPPVSSETMDTS